MLGPYRIGKLMGRGGMGEVYEAYDTVKERTVALKLLPPHLVHDNDFRERFERESKTAARLSDPHVIPIHDYGNVEGNLFIDMRLVDGKDLRDRLADGPLPPARAVDILGQIAGALDAAHRSGLVHRDVKPDNILVDNDDFAYLVDFGIAHAGTDSRLTRVGTALGTLAYMAPERFNDEPAGPSSDIYALTCVLYEAIVGTTPFPSTTEHGVITGHITKPPPQTGGPLDPIIAKGLAKEPGQRYGTARELMKAAAAALSAPQAPPTPRPHVTPPPPPGGFGGGPGTGPRSGQFGPAQQSGPHSGPYTPTSGPHSGPYSSGGYSGPPSGAVGASGISGPPSGPHTPAGPPHGPSGPVPLAGGGGFGPPPNYSGPQSTSGPQPWGPTPVSQPPKKSNTGRNLAIAGAVAVVVIALVVTSVVLLSGGDSTQTTASTTASTSTSGVPAGSTADCDYTEASTSADKAQIPGDKQPDTGEVNASFTTPQGVITMTLDRSVSPCNVGAMVSLIQESYFNNKYCLTGSTKWLLCGPSSGRDTTNPGWTSPNEFPTDLPAAGTNKDGEALVTYPRGTVAVYTNKDQRGSSTFFMTTQPIDDVKTFSIIGKLDSSGLATLEKILALGYTPHSEGATAGSPKENIVIQRATVETDAN